VMQAFAALGHGIEPKLIEDRDRHHCAAHQ
jgi:hypothetical protein